MNAYYNNTDSSGKYLNIYQLVIVGDNAVGKTTLVNKFANNIKEFKPSYFPTIGVD